MLEKLNNKDRLHNIDFLRIILISAIIIHHVYHAQTGIWNRGGLAVEFFFIIAGFILNMKNCDKIKTTFEFIVKKLVVFLPLLICSSTILSVFYNKFSFQKLMAELLLFQRTGLIAGEGFGYYAPAWFVSVLFWVMLFIFYLRKTTSEKMTNLILGVLNFFSLVFIVNQVKMSMLNAGLVRGIASITMGYFCGEFCKIYPKEIVRKKSILVTLFEFGILGYISYIIFSMYKVSNNAVIMFLMSVLMVLFYYRKGWLSSMLNKQIFTKMSSYVFSVFMTHGLWYRQPVFAFFQKLSHENLIILFVVCLLVSWAAGILFYYLIQIPCQKYLTNKILNSYYNKLYEKLD